MFPRCPQDMLRNLQFKGWKTATTSEKNVTLKPYFNFKIIILYTGCKATIQNQEALIEVEKNLKLYNLWDGDKTDVLSKIICCNFICCILLYCNVMIDNYHIPEIPTNYGLRVWTVG